VQRGCGRAGRETVQRHHRRTSRPAVTGGGLLSSSGGSKQPRPLPGLSARARNVRHSRPAATVSSPPGTPEPHFVPGTLKFRSPGTLGPHFVPGRHGFLSGRERQTRYLLPEADFSATRERRRPPALPDPLPAGQLPLLPAASTPSESPIALGRRSPAAAEPRNARLRCQVLPGPQRCCPQIRAVLRTGGRGSRGMGLGAQRRRGARGGPPTRQ